MITWDNAWNTSLRVCWSNIEGNIEQKRLRTRKYCELVLQSHEIVWIHINWCAKYVELMWRNAGKMCRIVCTSKTSSKYFVFVLACEMELYFSGVSWSLSLLRHIITNSIRCVAVSLNLGPVDVVKKLVLESLRLKPMPLGNILTYVCQVNMQM